MFYCLKIRGDYTKDNISDYNVIVENRNSAIHTMYFFITPNKNYKLLNSIQKIIKEKMSTLDMCHWKDKKDPKSLLISDYLSF